MMGSKLSELIDELIQLSKQQLHPFPYADCRKIFEISGTRDEHLIPDLDTYFYDLWSASSGIKHLLRRPLAEIEADKRYFAVSLEEKYAKHKHLLALVSVENTPSLLLDLQGAARMREKLLEILSLHLQSQDMKSVS